MSTFFEGFKQAQMPPAEQEEAYSNRAGRMGMPAYLTTSGSGSRTSTGDMEGPLGFILPGDSPLTYLLASALGVAIAGVPGSLLSKKLGPLKGYAAGAAISGAILTGLWYLKKQKTAEQKGFSAQINVKGVG